MAAGLLHQLKHLFIHILAFGMQLDMVTVQGAFLYKVGAYEALLQLPEQMKLKGHMEATWYITAVLGSHSP